MWSLVAVAKSGVHVSEHMEKNEMKVVREYPDGVFCWIDLATTDAGAAKAFYEALFGWQYEDVPTGGDSVYSMCQIDGKNVAGLSTLDPESLANGVPPLWSSYVKHDEVDAIATKVTEAGGKLMMPPMDVFETGRMLFAFDPSGAAFGVWQPKSHIGAQLVNMPNTLVWNELQTPDAEASKSFYGAVFGWEDETDPNGYVSFKAGGRLHAGMMQLDETMSEVPPNWSVYIMVEDAAATTAKAEQLGANILLPLTEAGDIGTFSVVQDPQGAVFSLMQFNGPVSPPPGH
jgi:predicted enzyme related to lactoylglutathione lyase